MTAALDDQPQPPDHLDLAAAFDAAGRDDWRAAVAAVLRKSGALGEGDGPDQLDLAEAKLSTTTYDGIDVLPLYTADDAPGGSATADHDGAPGAVPFTRAATATGTSQTGWDVRQRHAHPDPKIAHDQVMTDLENGVTSLWLAVGEGAIPLGSLDDVLRDVYLDLAPVVLDAGAATEAAATEYLGVVASRGVLPESVGGNLGADPIGLHARTGDSDVAAGLSVLTALAARTRDEFTGIRAAVVDATPYHEAGGSDADELGAALATGVAYVRALVAAGFTAEQAFGQLEFRYAASADQFLTIAKFRAARRVWARVGEVLGVPEAARGQRQHGVTSSAMMSRRDPWVNMLRTTLACFGAGVGGAQAVTVQPFDAAIGLSDDLARRIARNTSSLLVLESHVARVIDPAGGSYYVEKLTDDLAAAAWAWFQELERAGGIVAALDSGLVLRRLDAVWDRRAKNLATRRDQLTGVSEFPNVAEAPVERTPYPEAARREGGLPVRRYADEYEALRDAADAATEANGSRPSVFVAALGPASAYTARVTFAAALFQAGGFATPNSADLGAAGTDPVAIAEAFTKSGAVAAVLATSDKVYAEHAAPVAEALKQAGARHVWLAGKAGDRAESDAAAGIDGYVFTGVDALAVLREAQAVAGIEGGAQ
ncbi:methylmalonyl-CoA mutase subunit beta [Spongisporangium articulatum]|uniref:Methylmalonyl-CoA mutase subunit beta n=1 Tax=Spongisporangium articulatum TaxID=3362603 RepID=A0ABW8AUK9_9ACTN